MAGQGLRLVKAREGDTGSEPSLAVTTVYSATATSTRAPAGLVNQWAQVVQRYTPALRAAQTVTIQSLGNGRVFVHPLFVTIEQAGDEWFAVSSDLTLVGRGESDLDALDDLRVHIAEMFDDLLEMRDSLGPHLLSQLAFLERLTRT